MIPSVKIAVALPLSLIGGWGDGHMLVFLIV